MKKLDQLKETYKKLGEEIKNLENPKIDFSKWIGRYTNTLAIKGDKYLKSYSSGGIAHSNYVYQFYTDKINYEHTTLDKLKKGDVFICECDLANITLSDFCIYISINYESYNVYQYLQKNRGVENISSSFYIDGNTKVIKFLRH